MSLLHLCFSNLFLSLIVSYVKVLNADALFSYSMVILPDFLQ